MILHCQAEVTVGTAQGLATASFTCYDHSLADLFDRLLDQIALDFGTAVPDSISIVISKG